MASRSSGTPAGNLPLRELPAFALREVLRKGYTRGDFRKDLLAGMVVGIVALPLAMALSIAIGAPPQHGLYTAIVAGLAVALLGGSRLQVTGPTAAFVVILAPILREFGMAGLLVSGLMAGIMLVIMGLARMGRLIEFIPHPVTTGFTAGIGTVIALLQMKDLFGLKEVAPSDHFLGTLSALFAAGGTASGAELGVGLGTLGVLVFFPRISRKIPSPLVALPLAALAAWMLESTVDGLQIMTLAERFQTEVGGRTFHGIPPLPPLPLLPWDAAGVNGRPFVMDFDTFRQLLPGAFAIAMLGAIESLLSAVVADGMARTRHNPDAEIMALGVGNILAPFFGGIPATGAIARTATNVRSGAQSPVASAIHALVVLAGVLVLAPLVGRLPMTAMAALLLLVAWNMADVKHVRRMLKIAPRADLAVLVTCYGLTVVFDMVIAVTVGVVLAALLFMRRMAGLTSARLVSAVHPELDRPLPPGVVVYDLDGPLFFGAAQRAMAALEEIADQTRVVILGMDEVPHMDATGLVALESALEGLDQRRCLTIIADLPRGPRLLMRKGGVRERFPRLVFKGNLAAALHMAESHVGGTPPPDRRKPTERATTPRPA